MIDIDDLHVSSMFPCHLSAWPGLEPWLDHQCPLNRARWTKWDVAGAAQLVCHLTHSPW